MDSQKYTKIESYIRNHPLAVLGTINEDGTPHGAVVYICTDDHHPIVYFITKNSTQKYKNLISRPDVSVTITNPTDVSTLQAKGQASQVLDGPTLDMITTKITRTLAKAPEWLPPVSKLRGGQYVMVAIELTEARLAEYKDKQIGDEGIFTEI